MTTEIMSATVGGYTLTFTIDEDGTEECVGPALFIDLECHVGDGEGYALKKHQGRTWGYGLPLGGPIG